MQLTKLDIKGFKSFGDKVTIHFDKGITGVVGPNGCGKSNIVDSIRWVLGEQKTSALRSEKMENIIFNGTKNRKALQMAEVSLTFKNTKNLIPTEFNEVTITRRYYRSGESEYLLNNVSCRLKDITNLFLDTGIGSDSYAIIELKMVDNILNDKDHSRRTLFEEAAGISKFKVRKKESLAKLKTTDKDLERVEDVLFEIEKNLKSLEKQAKQAESYHLLKTQYKEFSVALSKKSLEKHTEKIEELKLRIENETLDKTATSSKIAELNANIEQLKTDLLQKEQLVASRQKTLNEHVNKTRQYESDKKIKNERLRYLNERSANLTDQLASDKLNIEQFSKEISILSKQKEELILVLKDLENILEDISKELNNEKDKQLEIKNKIQEFGQQEKEKNEEWYQLKKSIELSEIQLKNLLEELQKTHVATDSYSGNLADMEGKQSILAQKIKDQTFKIDTLTTLQKKIEQSCQDIEVKIAEEKEKIAQVNRQLDSKSNEFNLTKSLVDNLEGFPEAIKFLKKNNEWNNNSPLLSDVLSCSPEYRVAIENYLEPWMNFYVVENAAQAYRAVNILKNSTKGKANFFIMDQLKKKSTDEKSIPSNCINAISLIEYDPAFTNLIHHLLGDVLILNDQHDNIPENQQFIYLKKDGSLIHKRDSILGGSVGLFEGKRIGRAKNLEKLEKDISKINDQKSKVQLNIERLTNDLNKEKASFVKSDIEQARIDLEKLNEEYMGVNLKLEQFTSYVSTNATKKEDLLKNIEILKDGIDKSQPRLELMKVDLENVRSLIQEQNNTLENQSLRSNEISQKYNSENIKTLQTKNKLENNEREILFKEENLTQTQQRIVKNNLDIEKTDSEIKNIIDKEEISDDQLLNLYEEKEQIEKGVNEAEKEYYAQRNQIDLAEKELRSVNQNKDGKDQIILELQSNLNELKLTMSSIKERLSIEFKIDLNQLTFDGENETENKLSEQELNEKVIEFRNKIDRLGPINPMAMEAYNEIKERYDFIIEQRKDLSEAKKSLLETIAEIDEVAKVNFEKAFGEINANFQKVFRSLFTQEDTCELILSDANNPLEADIDIIARPKGKKPLSINQLSGGEKTLTAVALLFAIYLIKPAPFCIFDEVDAPLDDANIDKFNNIIREFSKDSQFILVTHNKRTMSTTDVMYGVTMQESGVSKLVPVDLRDLEDETVKNSNN